MSLPQSKTQYLTVPGTAKSKSLKSFSTDEVATHNKEGDLSVNLSQSFRSRSKC